MCNPISEKGGKSLRHIFRRANLQYATKGDTFRGEKSPHQSDDHHYLTVIFVSASRRIKVVGGGGAEGVRWVPFPSPTLFQCIGKLLPHE